MTDSYMTRLLNKPIFEVESSQLSKQYHPKNMKVKLALYFLFMISLPILSLGFTIGWAIPVFIVIPLGAFFWFAIEGHYKKRYPPNTPILQITQDGMYFPSIEGSRIDIKWSELKSIKSQTAKGYPVLELVLNDTTEAAAVKQPPILARNGTFYRLHLGMYPAETQKSIIDAIKSAAVLCQPNAVIS